VILLNAGEIAKEGNPEDVINSYNFLISKLNDNEEKMQIKNAENTNLLIIILFSMVIRYIQ
jgi:lipopolysaccharide transport system ATP-binding protein